MAKVYVGDEGTVIQIDCGTNVSGADDWFFKVLKPNTSTEETWDAAVAGGETDIIEATVDGTTIALDVAGEYRIQPYIDNLDGWTGRGETVRLLVHAVQE